MGLTQCANREFHRISAQHLWRPWLLELSYVLFSHSFILQTGSVVYAHVLPMTVAEQVIHRLILIVDHVVDLRVLTRLKAQVIEYIFLLDDSVSADDLFAIYFKHTHPTTHCK